MSPHDKPSADEREALERQFVRLTNRTESGLIDAAVDLALAVRAAERRDAGRRVEEARAEMRLPNTCQREAGIRWMAERLVEWKIEEDPAFIAAALYRVMMAARDDKDQP